MFTAQIYSRGVQQNWILYFYTFLFTIIFQRFSQNKYKRKGEKPLSTYGFTGLDIVGTNSCHKPNGQDFALINKHTGLKIDPNLCSTNEVKSVAHRSIRGAGGQRYPKC